MKKLFLVSSFRDVANIFENFASEDLKGKTVRFIPTTRSIPESYKSYAVPVCEKSS